MKNLQETILNVLVSSKDKAELQDLLKADEITIAVQEFIIRKLGEKVFHYDGKTFLEIQTFIRNSIR